MGVGERDATTSFDVHGLVTMIPMEHTRLGELGFIEHSNIQLCIGNRPLQILLLLHFIHTSEILYSNRHLSPLPSVPNLDRLVGSCTRLFLVVLGKAGYLYLKVGTFVGALLVCLGAHILFVEEPILVLVVFIDFLKVVSKFHVPLFTHKDGNVTHPW